MNGTSSCQPFVCTDLQVRLSAKGTDTVLMVSIASTGVVLWWVAYTIDAEFRLLDGVTNIPLVAKADNDNIKKVIDKATGVPSVKIGKKNVEVQAGGVKVSVKKPKVTIKKPKITL